jgi:hypothetical protein
MRLSRSTETESTCSALSGALDSWPSSTFRGVDGRQASLPVMCSLAQTPRPGVRIPQTVPLTVAVGLIAAGS